MSVAPNLLGDGVRLYQQLGGAAVKLERLDVTEAPFATNLWFRFVRCSHVPPGASDG